MTARVLVTAALGNVGRQVVRACQAQGLVAKHLGELEAVRFDFLDRTSWAEAVRGVDFVFLLRPPPIGDMSTTLNPFIDAAYAAGVKHVVFMSVAGAETKTWVPHRKVEDHLKTTGRAWTVLRPGFFSTNLADAYRPDLLEDDRFYVPAGDGRVAFLDVADIGDVAAKVLSNVEAHRGEAIRLAGPEAVTFTQLAQQLTPVVGRPIRYVAASLVGYVWHLWAVRRLPLMQVVVQTILHVGLRSGEAAEVDDACLRLLGRGPRPLSDYLERSKALWVKPVSSGSAEVRAPTG
jgi:uncharacterized protein YbjT (DUF2867 family)